MVSGPTRWTNGRSTQPGPRRTRPSMTTCGPTSTVSSSSASGDTTAVGWMRADHVLDIAPPVAGRGGHRGKRGADGGRSRFPVLRTRPSLVTGMYTPTGRCDARPVCRGGPAGSGARAAAEVEVTPLVRLQDVVDVQLP